MYPLGAGLPKLALEALDVSDELLHFLDCRFLKVLGPTAPVPTYPVTTALVILLKATAHGQDLQRVVREMDTFDWGTKELRRKLDYTTPGNTRARSGLIESSTQKIPPRSMHASFASLTVAT